MDTSKFFVTPFRKACLRAFRNAFGDATAKAERWNGRDAQLSLCVFEGLCERLCKRLCESK